VTGVVTDAGPPHYLVLIEAIDLLPRLFGTVVMPEQVCAELSRPRTPAPIRDWLASAPSWLSVQAMPDNEVGTRARIGKGELSAIVLAKATDASLVLMDDRTGVVEARAQGLEVTGTLGILERASAKGFVDLPLAIARLRSTNFRYRGQLLDNMVARHRSK
jgi:predicted nucleic acid-binding protein